MTRTDIFVLIFCLKFLIRYVECKPFIHF